MRKDGDVVILPPHLERIMGICVDGEPVQMRSGWFEFVQYGPGALDGRRDFSGVVLERGETCLQREWPAGGAAWRLRVEGVSDERDGGGARPVVNLQGEDAEGRLVRTQGAGGVWVTGENVEINGDTPPFEAVSSAVFSRVSAVVKPVTRGAVRLWAVPPDGGAGDAVFLGEYGAGETAPVYRRYQVPGAEGSCVLARCRRRFVPVRDENDVLIISNIRALKAMIMAIEKHDSGNVENLPLYNAYRANAVGLMRTEAAAYRGKARTPAMDFQRGASIGGDMPIVR
jgi:hypothetical protein